MTESEALELLAPLEDCNNLYQETYLGIPIYRLFRWIVCPAFIKTRNEGFAVDNSIKSVTIKRVLKATLYSICDIVLLLIREKNIRVVFFPNFRLFDIDNGLMDKFSDPIISESGIESNSIILQRSYYMEYRHKRKNKKRLCQVEVIDFISYAIPKFIYPFYSLTKKKKEIDNLIRRIGNIIKVDSQFRKRLHYEFLSFVVAYRFYKFFLKKIGCKYVIAVIKGNNYPQILAAHQLGLKAYEIQHGVTMDKTILYGGTYNAILDPDAFLTFGEMWKGPQFGMPLDRIYNIGFAYKNYIKKVVPEIIDNAVLVVSSPEITEPMVNATLLLASSYPEILFYFRPHPHEGLTEEQLQSVAKYDNIRFSDKSVDSNIEVVKYKYVIGTNSSVLFEAASLGAKVGRLRFAGLDCMHFQGDENFCYIDTVKDFETFLNKEFKIDIEAYSDFNKELFLSLIN